MRDKKPLTLQRSQFPFSRKSVRKAMLDADLRVIDLARRFAVSPGTVSLVVDGRTRNLLLQQAIAAALKVPIASLWNMTPGKARKQKSSARSASVRSSTEAEPLSLAAGGEA